MTNTILCGGLMTNSERDLTEFRGGKNRLNVLETIQNGLGLK